MIESMESDVRPLKRLRLPEDVENTNIGEHFFYLIDFPVPLFAIASHVYEPLNVIVETSSMY